MGPLWERVEELHVAGLKSSSIVWEFLEQRLAPLQRHRKPCGYMQAWRIR